MNIKFELNKLYYKYINTSIVNHYKLLLLTEEYRKISKTLFDKYPQSNIEYIDCSKKQSKIKKDFFENREIICKNNKNKDLIICSDMFENFYVSRKYHYEQCIENVIEHIITDIKSMDKF